MEKDLATDFQIHSERVLSYHSHFVSLMSGIVIGLLTNYLITFVFPLPVIVGLSICCILIIISLYVFFQYSPLIVYGQAVEDIPLSLKVFLNKHYDKLLWYIQADLGGYAFHKDSISHNGFMGSIDNIEVTSSQIFPHQGEITVQYPFFKFFNCEILLQIYVSSMKSRLHNVTINFELNRFARLHPKTDLVLRTLGKRLHHAVTNPQLVYPDISNEEFHEILKDLRPYMLEDD